MNRNRKAVVLVLAGFAALAAGALAAYRQHAPQVPASGAAAMLFAQTLPDGEGTPRSLSSYRGQVLVVNFWATWCAPCVEEIPAFSRLQTEYGAKVKFLGIGIDTASNIASFQQKIRPSYPLLVAGAVGTELAREFGDRSGGLPFTVVLGAGGDVKAVKVGRVDEKELRAWLTPLFPGPS